MKKLDPLLEGLAVLRKEHVTVATVVAAIHKCRILPLALWVLFLYQMMPEATLFRTQILEEPVPALENSHRILQMVASELEKDYRFIPMCPEESFPSKYSFSLPYLFLRLPLQPFLFLFVSIAEAQLH